MQKQLEIDSVAMSEHNNKQHVSEAGQQGQGKGAKEEKVCACVCTTCKQSMSGLLCCQPLW